MNRVYSLLLLTMLSIGNLQINCSQKSGASAAGAAEPHTAKDFKATGEQTTNVSVLQQSMKEVDAEEHADSTGAMTATAAAGVRANADQKRRVDFNTDHGPRTSVYMRNPKISKHLAAQILADCPKEIQEINNILDFKGLTIGMRCIPKQMLFVGPPGTGKTKSAVAFASIHGLDPYLFRCSLISNEFHGSGDNNLRKIFERLWATKRPCALILDEFQELIKKHEDPKNGDTSMLSTLWGLLDDSIAKPMIVIATFNYVKKIPKQIESRFEDAIVRFDLPTLDQRKKAIEFHINAKKADAEFEKCDVEKLAKLTDGYSYRKIKKMVTKACCIAWGAKSNIVRMDEFIKAIQYLKETPTKSKDPKTQSWLFALKKHAISAAPQVISWAISIGIPLYINHLQTQKADSHMTEQQKMFKAQMNKQQDHFDLQMKTQSEHFTAQQLAQRQSMQLQYTQLIQGSQSGSITGENGESYSSGHFKCWLQDSSTSK